LKEFRQAIALDPDFALAHLRLFQQGGVESETELRRALQLADRLPEKEQCSAHAGLALVQGRQADALAQQKSCADRFPEDQWTVSVAAEWAFHAGEIENGARYFERLFELNPATGDATDHLMAAWPALGRFDHMVAVARDLTKERTPKAYANLVLAQLASGDPDAA